jgi:FkbM family methyltransferase
MEAVVMRDLELDVIRFVGHRLPRLPRVSGIVNRVLKPLYLRRPRSPVVCDVMGMRMELDPAEAVDGNLLFCPQLYEWREITYLIENLGTDDNFVDVGAHIGLYSLMACTRIANGIVVAIEPTPSTFQVLRKNIRLNKLEIRAVNCGVSDKEEKLSLHLDRSGNRGGNSFVEHAGGSTVDVPCFPLVDILRKEGVKTLRGMKIDVEGYEYKVLKHFFENAETTLYPTFIIAEFFEGRTTRTTGQHIELLETHGYIDVLRTRENRILVRAA